LDSVLALCEKQACKIREDIENLETHLTKYGYKKPTGII
jgi:N-acetyl-anhydromuramyl-L-alanine amidase AmpD